MSKLQRRSLARPSPPQDDDQPDDTSPGIEPTEGIPPHVWQLLQQAGDEAAQRLVELLEPARFNKLAGSVQRSLLDLAFTRAYGLPVRRSLAVNLSSGDADAVAASLQRLTASLPERGPQPRDVTPDAPEYPDE